MIKIYLDTSGSMTEMGKKSAAIYIAKSIEDYCDFKFIESKIYQLDGVVIENLTSLKFSNDIKIDLKDPIENSILISDGLFESKDIKIFDVVISVGIDSDLLNLEKISKKSFISDNILSALEYLVFHNDLLETPSEETEDNDEW